MVRDSSVERFNDAPAQGDTALQRTRLSDQAISERRHFPDALRPDSRSVPGELDQFPAATVAADHFRFAQLTRPNTTDRSERSLATNRPEQSERRQITLKDAVVNLPRDLDPSKPIRFITYFNGFRSSHVDDYRNGNFHSQMANAPPNTVLISARWQDVEHSENAAHNQFIQNGGLRGVLKKVFGDVPELQRRDLRPNDTISLVGFSAGYHAVGKALSDRSLSANVRQIVMLDSPSSTVRQYVSDNLSAFMRGEKQLVAVAGTWRRADYEQFSNSLNEQIRRRGGSPSAISANINIDRDPITQRPLMFLNTTTRHGSIPARWLGRVAF